MVCAASLFLFFSKHSLKAAILNDLLEHKYLSKTLNHEIILQLVDRLNCQLNKLLKYVSKSLNSPANEFKNTLKTRVGPLGEFNIVGKKNHI